MAEEIIIERKKYRIDDLGVNNLKILQDPDGYCFTSDAVILANFAKVKSHERGVDLGSGSGIISILLAGKYGAKHMTAIEIQEEVAAMSRRSIELNGLTDKIEVLCMPMQQAAKVLKTRFDVVVTNPPYTRAGDGERNLDHALSVSRHEVKVTLAEVVKAAADLVKYGGRFYMIHQCERLSEIFAELNRNNFEPKVLRFVQGKEGIKPTLVMIEALSYGKPGLIVRENLVLYDKEGNETPELKKIYSR